MNLLIGWILLQLINGIYAIVGYDCGTNVKNLTTLSLLEVGKCDISKEDVRSKDVRIQLLQLIDFATTHVYQCKVEIHRVIHFCGMHSHISLVANGDITYIEELTREDCVRMQTQGFHYTRTGHHIPNIPRNGTLDYKIDFAGKVDYEGNCRGTTYIDQYGSWENVVVRGSVKISMQDYEANVNLDTNQIHLRSGTVCSLTDTKCTDFDGGPTFWASMPTDDKHCNYRRYGLLYKGKASIMEDKTLETSQTLYSLTSQDVTFALTAASKQRVCNIVLIRTEHPKLFIYEGSDDLFGEMQQTSVLNLDIFAYMNSKFVYVEKHLRTQMRQLYVDVIMQRCKLEQQVMKNSLSIATQSPDEFAYHLMRGPGFIASVAGEVVYILKCLPVEVQLRKTNECYSQLPVTHGNQNVFLSPRTHVILTNGATTTCNIMMPPMYFLGDSWYKLLPNPVMATSPNMLKPLVKQTWKYEDTKSLAISGIYSNAELAKLRDHIMSPVERPAILNVVARGMSGQSINNNKISLNQFLDEATLERIAESAWEKTWGRFITFGSASAGVIAIVMIIRGIKLVVDTIIHGYALHSIYGWSIHLIGAVWNSVTQLLLHLGAGKRNNRNGPPAPPSSPPSSNNKDPEIGQLSPMESLPTSQLYPEWRLSTNFPTSTYEPPRRLNFMAPIASESRESHSKRLKTSHEPHYQTPKPIIKNNKDTTLPQKTIQVDEGAISILPNTQHSTTLSTQTVQSGTIPSSPTGTIPRTQRLPL